MFEYIEEFKKLYRSVVWFFFIWFEKLYWYRMQSIIKKNRSKVKKKKNK